MQDLKLQSYSEWLVIRSQQGDVEAFNSLISHWRQRYLLYALHRLDDRELAQDVTQECLISISRSLGALADPVAYPKWSFQILERRCIDCLRRKIRERKVFAEQEQLIIPEPASEDTPDAALTIAQVLNRMDATLASVLRLYYLESFTIAEIAEINAVPVGTIKSRLFYARKLMLQKLATDQH